MRVVVAPDSFGGTLSAAAAADAIGAGWRRTAPHDDVTLLPLADGGTGFTDVLHAVLGGTRHVCTVTGPLGDPVTAHWLQVGPTAYVESAAAAGLHLVAPDRRIPPTALTMTSRGVGELVADAVATGVDEVVIGLGGSATTDGGAGLLTALGAVPVDADGVALAAGGAALADVVALAGSPTLNRVRLVAAVDVDNPLLGRHGAAAVFGPQKGADPAAVAVLDAALGRFAPVLAGLGHGEVAHRAGAGAAGGLGAALLALGASQVSGAALVRELVGLDAALDAAARAGGLALTGEGSFDWQSLRGKLVTQVAAAAAQRGLACLVLAGQVSVGRREAAAAGVDAAYAVADGPGGLAASLADPAATLAATAARVAAQWSRPPR